ncbi:hypothetical protein BKP37_05010 [Anaerobacillus alkalilacustris]|uniref:Uncharacterized protein n=1 Tax=Anaerobacillus alkalilacustris TaxID=393763 RepID=A0A1S2LW83_9BACI|nr:hypothetical protein BKP37_05010 [Anaerobacillus alkalilacustris]
MGFQYENHIRFLCIRIYKFLTWKLSSASSLRTRSLQTFSFGQKPDRYVQVFQCLSPMAGALRFFLVLNSFYLQKNKEFLAVLYKVRFFIWKSGQDKGKRV